MKKTLCDTYTVLLAHTFYLSPKNKNLRGVTNPENSMWRVGKFGNCSVGNPQGRE